MNGKRENRKEKVRKFKESLLNKEPQTVKQTAQAKEDHENAQITQGLRKKLEKIYNKNNALGTVYESLIDALEEMMALNTGISGMMDIQPTPVVGQRQPSYTRQGKRKEKKICNYNYKRLAHKRRNVQ